MNRSMFTSQAGKRLLGCLAGGFVLALMVGNQEGTQDDYGLAFREAILRPRIVIFLAIGVLAFLGITFWPRVVPYLARPGARPLGAGVITVLASLVLLKWFDPLGNGKFSTVATAVDKTPAISALASAFFGWLAWVLLAAVVVALGVGIVTRRPVLGWIAAALSVVAAVVGLLAHSAVAGFDPNLGVDHSLGSAVHALGYVVLAGAGVSLALSKTDIARTKQTFDAFVGWRPGLPLVVLGAIAGVLALGVATWFSPKNLNATMSDTHGVFDGRGLAALAFTFIGWLAWALLALAVVCTGVGAYLRNRILAAVGALIAVVAVLIALITLYDISDLGAKTDNFDGATGPWQNLGAGGWMACMAFTFLAAGGLLTFTAVRAVTDGRSARRVAASSDVLAGTEPAGSVRRTKQMFGSSPTAAALLFVVIAVALFYPPTTTSFWQTVLVSEIGVYVLLAIGLNVVVGWAGLLDLGFIAFYAIGSYTTAYLVGSLPVKPPSWLHMSPLLAIPFAIAVCLLAGVALGAPTLRLRGDYLAIVTLGFGEIIRIVAINNPGDFTNSTRGPSPQVPHPVIDLGFVRFTWGLNQLQYWYLLLVFIVVVLVLFYRLEGSRIGRAWAAVREDEVAAQATGINTTRVKLLAFAIGASTSGLAGVFFASQVGYFNPDNFVLNNSILVVAYVVFGGMGSLPGAIAGAAVLTWLPEFLKDQVPAVDRQMWIGAVVLLMMIFRPEGLIPARRRQAELHGMDSPPSSETRAVPSGEGLGGRA